MTTEAAARRDASREVACHAGEVLDRALDLVDVEPGHDGESLADRLRHTQQALRDALLQCEGAGAERIGALARALVEVTDACDDVARQVMDRRFSAVDQVQRALGGLRGTPTASAVMDRALPELCTHCGFDRAVLFRVEASQMIAEKVFFAEHEAWSQEVFEAARETPAHLTHLLLETEMLRRRRPVLVTDPQHDPRTFKPLVTAFRTTSYVAAPIMPGGKVIGFIHADRYFSAETVDEVDRDVLWAFAEGFGYAFERAAVLDRLRRQKAEMQRLVNATQDVVTELADAEVALIRSDAEATSVARSTTSIVASPDSRMASLLTRRELEVLGLLAEGATNARIAAELVISESTVKTHVRQVMRKLRASNRAEAVWRYHQIVQAGPSQDEPGRLR